ncbi:MAG: diguanylate cyclase domain-containing protein [Methylophilaceae bacterium]
MLFVQTCKKNIHLLILLVGILVGLLSIAYFVHNKDIEMRQALLTQVRSIDLALDWSSMYSSIQSSVTSSEHKNDSATEAKIVQYRTRMAAICDVYPNCIAVYLMRQNDKKQIYFLIDSDPKTSALYIEPGTIYKEASPTTYQVFETRKISMDGPVEDRWGTWISALVPHILPDKSVIVVGIDIEAKEWNKTLWKSAMMPAIVTMIFLALMTLFLKLWRTKEVENEVLEKSHLQLLKQSHEDGLTGLPNRRLFEDRLTQMIAGAERGSAKFAVFYLDLDKFKNINDTLGHDAGDELLRIASGRFKSVLRAEDTVARLSGDEFAMILPRIAQRMDAEQIAQKIIDTLRQPILLKDQLLNVTVSIGIVIYSESWTTAHEMTRAADEAMYVAKRAGADRYRFLQSA